MSIKNVRTLGFAKGVLHKGVHQNSFLDILKSALTELDVYWEDACCLTTAPDGTGDGNNQLFFANGTCITVTGAGVELNPYIVEPIISPEGDNVLQCTPNGLYVAAADLGLSISADNGLRMSTASNVQLGNPTAPGEPLLFNTFIDTQGLYTLQISGVAGNPFVVSATGAATSITGSSGANGGIGVNGTAVGTDSVGTTGSSALGIGIRGLSTTGLGGSFSVTPATTTTVVPVVKIGRFSSGSIGDNAGGAIDFVIQTGTSTERASNRILSKWTTSADLSRSAQLEFWGTNNAGALFEQVRINSQGDITGFGTGVSIKAISGTNGGVFQGTVAGVSATSAGVPLSVNSLNASTSTVVTGISITKNTGAGADGTGINLNFGLQNTASSNTASGQFINKFTTALAGSETSQFEFVLRNAGTGGTVVTMTGAGLLRLNQGASEYADNAAAVSAGLAIGTFYRTGDAAKIVH